VVSVGALYVGEFKIKAVGETSIKFNPSLPVELLYK
jgi:hypothetical protein